MRIVTFRRADEPAAAARLGVLLPGGGGILDVGAYAARQASVALPAGRPRDLDWYDLDGPWIAVARAALEAARRGIGEIVGVDRPRGDGVVVAAETVVRLAPVPRPGKIVCVGLNYRDHAAEARLPVPGSPVVFAKFSTAVVGPGAAIRLPKSSRRVDYEAELAVVIGRRARRVSRAAAMDVVLGYTAANDVSERDFQKQDGQWVRAKSCDTFAPMGPEVVTLDEIGSPHALPIRLRLNGDVMQDSNTSEFVFGVPALIEFLSASMTLEPGDVLLTGTPPGVGFARRPPVFLRPGDVVEVEIGCVGTLRNPVIADDGPPT